jgi:hypothetical protein
MASEQVRDSEPVKISVAVYDDGEDETQHIMLEAKQGSFVFQHFMSAYDARMIGIALCDAANEVELGQPWAEAKRLEGEDAERILEVFFPGGNDSNESNSNPKVWSRHAFVGPGADCAVCGRPVYDSVHAFPD